ncbi:MAG: EAL domain-containing protein [Myxococcota bacterium]
MHKLKPSAQLVGASVLGTCPGLLEDAGKNDDLQTQRELWPLLENAWKLVRGDLVRRRRPCCAAAADLGAARAAAPAAAVAERRAGRQRRPRRSSAWRRRRGRCRRRARGRATRRGSAACAGHRRRSVHHLRCVTDLLASFGLARVSAKAGDGRSGLERVQSRAEIDLVLAAWPCPAWTASSSCATWPSAFLGQLHGVASRQRRRARAQRRRAGAPARLQRARHARQPFSAREALAVLLGQHRPAMARRSRETRLLHVSPDELEQAIRVPGITIHLQPKVRHDTLGAVGVEALARWFRTEGGPVPPTTFVRVAEGNGLADALFHSTLLGAVAGGGAAARARRHDLKVSVNVSATSLARVEVAERILEATVKAGVDPKRLVLEVTETGLVRDLRIALDVLTRLRLHGIELSIDDFGTGYSSIDLLRQRALHRAEGRPLVRHEQRARRSARHIIASSVGLARGLGMRVVAEGDRDRGRAGAGARPRLRRDLEATSSAGRWTSRRS